MFWKLTFLIYFLGVIFGGSILKSALTSDKKGFIFVVICFFCVCMEVSNILIDILACYGIKPV